MTKYRAVKNKKHRLAKMIRRVRRVDDWADMNKNYAEVDRQAARQDISNQVKEVQAMSDDEILERGGTQEDINRYAHDVGGAKLRKELK